MGYAKIVKFPLGATMIEDNSNIEVDFKGPYFWVEDHDKTSIFDNAFSGKSGVYLWTIAYQEKELIYYVGQTGRSFSTRMAEHFYQHASGGYHLYEPEEFLIGNRVAIWSGRYDSQQRTTIPEFLEHYKELAPIIEELAGIYRFWLAPVNLDSRMRQRMEAAICLPLYDQPGVIGSFQEKGVRYAPRWDAEIPVKAKIANHSTFHGLPDELFF